MHVSVPKSAILPPKIVKLRMHGASGPVLDSQGDSRLISSAFVHQREKNVKVFSHPFQIKDKHKG